MLRFKKNHSACVRERKQKQDRGLQIATENNKADSYAICCHSSKHNYHGSGVNIQVSEIERNQNRNVCKSDEEKTKNKAAPQIVEVNRKRNMILPLT